MDNIILFLVAGFVGGVIGALGVRLTRYLRMQQRQIDDLKRELEEMKRKE